jgi:predicted nucleic acid-binding protein
MPSKTAIADASSVIILHKAGLLPTLVEVYRVILAGSVYQEITANPYCGATECKSLRKEKMIRVEAVTLNAFSVTQKMDRGEAETIQLYTTGHGDFIITDDGAAARYCKREGIPFINALLFPLILKHTRARTDGFCNKAFEVILELGRYSDKVVDLASSCDKENISFALP